LATTTNNFIQGTTLGEMCIFNDSLLDSPILFGIRTSTSGLTNEVGRFAANGNFSITNGRIILNGNSSDLAAVMILGSATYPTGKIIAPNTGGTILIGGQSGTGMTIDTTGAAIFSNSVTTNGGGFIGNMASTQSPALIIDRTSTAFNGIIKFTTGGVDKWILGNRNTSDETFKIYNYNISADVLTITNTGYFIPLLPTSSAGLPAGALWNNLGIVSVA